MARVTSKVDLATAEPTLAGFSPHAEPAEDVLARLGVDPQIGLSADEVRKRRTRFGPNELKEPSSVPVWRRFLAQFIEPMVAILVVAAVVSGLLGDVIDTLAVLAIVLLNGVIGFIQEERAERALKALKQLSAPLAKVKRVSRLQTVKARDLVPGDLLVVEAGDSVAADARLIRSYNLRAHEAALTGESVPITKNAAAISDPHTPLGDRTNMVFLGTSIAAGKSDAVVVATGMETELGRIAGMLEHAEREATPLQRRLAQLGKILIVVILAIVAVIFVFRVVYGGDRLESFLLAVSLAVAAVPEGLPTVVTLVLAIGLQRLVERNALIRRLPAVETLGSVTVICSDKTGTLTRNEMTVREVVTGSAHYHVSGAGYEPRGAFHQRADEGGPDHGEAIDPRDSPDLMRAMQIAAWCNTAQVAQGAEGKGGWHVIGDPTEGALVVAARKADVKAHGRDDRMLHEIPFDSERKAMSVLVRSPDDSAMMYTKGAPEVILGRCDQEWRHGQIERLTAARRGEIRLEATRMASRAMRVLALAYRHHPDARHPAARREEDLVFVGLVGMIDPPRDEVRVAVHLCRNAGIRPVMITGDHPATALTIGRELGIARDGDRVLTGQELDALGDNDLAGMAEAVSVYARVSAEHKLRVVRALKARGNVVAMTGDGVNDAPALKAADIGVAMGITGTEVAKQASDMVLCDDNFASIVAAVAEGRGIFDNIRKFIHYLLASNASEILLMLLAAVVGWPAPLTAVQLLWINLVTDGFPALALGMEPPERDVMQRPPHPPNEPVINLHTGLTILYHGVLMAMVGVVSFAMTYGHGDNLRSARAAAFGTMAFTQLFFSFACRSHARTLPELGLLSNPYLFWAIAASAVLQFVVVTLPPARAVFGIPSDQGQSWLHVLPLALVPVTIIEGAKLLRGYVSARERLNAPEPKELRPT
jgi:Ca2+-transporting ATPase